MLNTEEQLKSLGKAYMQSKGGWFSDLPINSVEILNIEMVIKLDAGNYQPDEVVRVDLEDLIAFIWSRIAGGVQP